MREEPHYTLTRTCSCPSSTGSGYSTDIDIEEIGTKMSIDDSSMVRHHNTNNNNSAHTHSATNMMYKRRSANFRVPDKGGGSGDSSGGGSGGGGRRRRLVRSTTYLHSPQQHNNILDMDAPYTTVALCTCQQSHSYPFCDNTHHTFNKETNSTISPLIVAILDDNNNIDCNNCGAKLLLDVTKSSNSNPPMYSSSGDKGINLVKSNSSNSSSGSSNNNISSSILGESQQPPIVDNIDNLYSTSNTMDMVTPPPSCIKSPISLPDSNNNHNDNNNHNNTPLPPPSKYTPSSIKNNLNRNNIITAQEVSQHNTLDSLWMIIKGNVYDITKYVSSHPGGHKALLKFAGRDGTENVQFHSAKMLEILNSNYFIGKLYVEEAPSKCTIS